MNKNLEALPLYLSWSENYTNFRSQNQDSWMNSILLEMRRIRKSMSIRSNLRRTERLVRRRSKNLNQDSKKAILRRIQIYSNLRKRKLSGDLKEIDLTQPSVN